MIISHKHKYIFLKVYKTASTSVQVALSRYIDPQDICTGNPLGHPNNPPQEEMHPHATAIQIRNNFPEYWNEYFKFGYTRNPWDHVVSGFCHRHRKKVGKMKCHQLLIRDFINEIENAKLDIIHPHLYMCPFTAMSIDGQVGVDFVCRFEKLNADLKYICKRLGIPYNGKLPEENTRFRVLKQQYSHWYTDKARDVVAKLYQDTIDIFEYTFEDQR